MDRHAGAVAGVHQLIVLRGPSGSGKSSTARALRERLGRGTAWIEQDYLRRILLREKDVPGGSNIDLIELTVRFALERGMRVVLEGILQAGHYAPMLERLHRDYAAASAWYFFDISFQETVRRHATRPQATHFSTAEMRDWYLGRDLLPFVQERIISEDTSAADTLERIYRAAHPTPGALTGEFCP